MKITVYIEKSDFDEFFKWMNRLNLGIFSTPPVEFSHRESDIQDPLKILLDSRDYSLIRDTRQDIEELQNTYGSFEIDFSPESAQGHLLVIQDIIREAQRRDLLNEVVFTALQVATQIRDITPAESMIVAEREWLKISQDDLNDI
jgi:hypothetical protein